MFDIKVVAPRMRSASYKNKEYSDYIFVDLGGIDSASLTTGRTPASAMHPALNFRQLVDLGGIEPPLRQCE